MNNTTSITLKDIVDTGRKTIGSITSMLGNMKVSMPGKRSDDCGCCPPKKECPPRCLTTITKSAFAGERIIVPFKVRNTCNTPRMYQVGVRELKDENGNLAPGQPSLNKTTLNLNGGESQLVYMTLDLVNFPPGHSFATDIVLREKDINQNICFTLNVGSYTNIPEARPIDEKKYYIHFQDWRSHFYCEPKKRSGVTFSAVTDEQMQKTTP